MMGRIYYFLFFFSFVSAQNLSTTSTEATSETSTTEISILSTSDSTSTFDVTATSSETSLASLTLTSIASAASNTTALDWRVEDASGGVVAGYVAPSDESWHNDDRPDPGDGDPDMPLGLPLEDAIELNDMEIALYKDFAENAPAGGEAPMKIPNVTCASMLSKRKWSPQNPLNCKTYRNLGIMVYFHNVRSDDTAQPDLSETRLASQMDMLNKAYNPLGIKFETESTMRRYWYPSFSNHKKMSASYKSFLQKYRKGGKTALNVWICDSLHRGDVSLNGYALSPQMNADVYDGVYIDRAAVGTEFRNTLIHEVGHWMGLKHTFGNVGSNCDTDDDLLDTEQTSGTSTWIYECVQTLCNGEWRRVENHMSYSRCRGSSLAFENGREVKVYNYNAFTTNQKARMFARFLKLRQGVIWWCALKDPSVTTLDDNSIAEPTPILGGVDRRNELVDYDQLLTKRKLPSIQNVIDGVCPDPSAPDSPDVVATNGGFGTSRVPVASGTGTVVIGSAQITPQATSVTGFTGGTRSTSTSSGSAAATSSKSSADRLFHIEFSTILISVVISLILA